MHGVTSAIEIVFPVGVELAHEDERALLDLIGRICARYVAAHPGRVMWASGYGAKLLTNPLMLDDDEPIPFDDSVLHVECFEREDYDWRCAKCGRRQDEHADLMLQPAAGACEFEPAATRSAEVSRAAIHVVSTTD